MSVRAILVKTLQIVVMTSHITCATVFRALVEATAKVGHDKSTIFHSNVLAIRCLSLQLKWTNVQVIRVKTEQRAVTSFSGTHVAVSAEHVATDANTQLFSTFQMKSMPCEQV